jgi:hypothetical protein
MPYLMQDNDDPHSTRDDNVRGHPLFWSFSHIFAGNG